MDRAFMKFSRHQSSMLPDLPDPDWSCNSPLRYAVYARHTARRDRWSPCGSDSSRCRASASARCDWLLGLYQMLSADSNATTVMASCVPNALKGANTMERKNYLCSCIPGVGQFSQHTKGKHEPLCNQILQIAVASRHRSGPEENRPSSDPSWSTQTACPLPPKHEDVP